MRAVIVNEMEIKQNGDDSMYTIQQSDFDSTSRSLAAVTPGGLGADLCSARGGVAAAPGRDFSLHKGEAPLLGVNAAVRVEGAGQSESLPTDVAAVRSLS